MRFELSSDVEDVRGGDREDAVQAVHGYLWLVVFVDDDGCGRAGDRRGVGGVCADRAAGRAGACGPSGGSGFQWLR